MPSAGSSYAVTPGRLNTLDRTGADFDLVYGGVGHYLEEIEQARQLAKITRKTPAPIVQPPKPRLHPSAGAPVAPQPPAVDPGAIAAQRMARLQAQAEQARILRRRRRRPKSSCWHRKGRAAVRRGAGA
jgi:type IV secretory pathway VirB10-like protein